jgi:CcmD family protein
MNAYVIAGYSVAIISIVGYSFSLIFRRKSLRQQILKLKNELTNDGNGN